MFISRLTRLPIVNLDASSEALAVAEIFRARSQLQWRNIRVDVARMLARPEDQVALQAELPGSRPLFFSRACVAAYFSAEQQAALFDWLKRIGAIGGIHWEGPLGVATPKYERIRHSFTPPVEIDPGYVAERDTFKLIAARPDMEIVRRDEIPPHFVSRNWASLLGWRWH